MTLSAGRRAAIFAAQAAGANAKAVARRMHLITPIRIASKRTAKINEIEQATRRAGLPNLQQLSGIVDAMPRIAHALLLTLLWLLAGDLMLASSVRRK